MASALPFPTLLSQVLVAFVIEFDNEFELQMPHRTSSGPAAGSPGGPWLTSMAMWSNFMRFVDAGGTPLRALEGRARLVNLKGLQRWRYIDIEPSGADGVVRPTRGGRKAQEVWAPLAAVVEQRWQSRFGGDDIAGLTASLRRIADRLEGDPPDFLPVVAHGMFADVPPLPDNQMALELPALVSRVLLAFTIEFERESEVSLPISANGLRVLDDTGIRLRDLPRRSGVSTAAVSMMLGLLQRRGLAIVAREAADSHTKVARLTSSGLAVQAEYRRLLAATESRWESRFGAGDIGDLRSSLAYLVGGGTLQSSPLMENMRPYPHGWRAKVRAPDTLPHYPMVLHRGGYPDGS